MGQQEVLPITVTKETRLGTQPPSQSSRVAVPESKDRSGVSTMALKCSSLGGAAHPCS